MSKNILLGITGSVAASKSEILFGKVSKNNNVKIFKLAEILVRLKNDEILENSINEISKSIKEIGFENTALIYSQSNTAKNGGDIGWIKETSLSPKIKIELEY